jgi:predicted RNase H-like nuclease (RuvC/YqgF family)
MQSNYYNMSKETIANYSQYLNENEEQWDNFKKTMDEHFRLMRQQNTYIQTSKERYEDEIRQLKSTVHQSASVIDTLKSQLQSVEARYKDLQEELKHMKKLSIYTQLNKQISEQSNYIQVLEKRLNVRLPQTVASPRASTPVLPVIEKEEHVDEVVETHIEEYEDAEVETDLVEETESASNEGLDEDGDDEVDAEEEPEIEYETRKIGKKYYYVSNEEPAGIYQVVKETSDVGDKVGEYDSNNKAVFY